MQASSLFVYKTKRYWKYGNFGNNHANNRNSIECFLPKKLFVSFDKFPNELDAVEVFLITDKLFFPCHNCVKK
jgi:hypothetical protein